ncbi:MAG: DUF202 domain-containing protein [Micromonosporaceae bacterium]
MSSLRTPPPRPDPPRAAQLERTRLAWRRTVLTATAVALLGLRQAITADLVPARALGAAAVMLAWLATVAVSHRRIVMLSQGSSFAGRAPVWVAALTVGYAALGAAMLLA